MVNLMIWEVFNGERRSCQFESLWTGWGAIRLSFNDNWM